MTNEEAIKDLNAFIEYYKETTEGYPVCFDKAIEALKKQIPKKPEIDEFEGIDYWRGRYLHTQDSCPYCGIRLDTHFDYCCNCGQALDWGK